MAQLEPGRSLRPRSRAPSPVSERPLPGSGPAWAATRSEAGMTSAAKLLLAGWTCKKVSKNISTFSSDNPETEAEFPQL